MEPYKIVLSICASGVVIFILITAYKIWTKLNKKDDDENRFHMD